MTFAPGVSIDSLIVVAIAGLAVGSFLNVCIYRLPRKESVVFPASHCPNCGHALAWFDNVPVLGYLLLRGRCRDCREPISARYPIVEVVTAALFVLQLATVGWTWLLLPRLLMTAALIVLFAIDLEHRILPNVITLPGIAVGVMFSFALPPGWLDSLIGVFIGGGILLGIAELYYRLRREEGLGMGDVKMLAMVGAFLGWKLTILTLVLSSFMGSIVGLGVIAIKKGDLKYALPYGTFLAIAAMVASVVGNPLLNWYFSFY